MEEKECPIWEMYSLSIKQASDYFGIGEKKLYSIIRDNPNAEYILEIGTHIRIKRKLFESALDEMTMV